MSGHKIRKWKVAQSATFHFRILSGFNTSGDSFTKSGLKNKKHPNGVLFVF
jgi:hypothetical protein